MKREDEDTEYLESVHWQQAMQWRRDYWMLCLGTLSRFIANGVAVGPRRSFLVCPSLSLSFPPKVADKTWPVPAKDSPSSCSIGELRATNDARGGGVGISRQPHEN